MKKKKSYFFYSIFWIIALLIGCSSHWSYSSVFYSSQEIIWKTCKKALNLYGYQAKIEDKNKGYWESEWKEFLYPFRKGYRNKVVCKIVNIKNLPSENVSFYAVPLGTAHFYRIYLKVLRQSNIGVHDFMDSRHAVWLEDGYDLSFEHILLDSIEARLIVFPSQTQEEYRGK